MKVPRTHMQTQAQPIRVTRPSQADRTVQDRVTVTPAPRVFPEAIAAGKRIAAADRADRLQRLSAAVKSGQYVPDPQHIAGRLLEHAELDAQLRAPPG